MSLDFWHQNNAFTNAIAELLLYKKKKQQKEFNLAY